MPPTTRRHRSRPPFVQAVADVLACTDWPGLSNPEIGRLLGRRWNRAERGQAVWA